MAVKCKINGRAKVLPGGEGECPECLTPDVPVTDKGFVGSHDVKINLGEGVQIAITDEGTRVGDPRDAAVRRELDAIKVRKGDVPVPEADSADPVETTGHGRAPVLVRGRAMEPFASDVLVSPVGTPKDERVTDVPEDTRKGFAGQAGTMWGPTGRERSEPEAMHGGAYGYLTRAQYDELNRSQQRKYWYALARMKEYRAERRASATRVLVKLGTGGIGGASFAEHTSRVTERVMREVPEH